MQTTITFVLLFFLRTISLDVAVYKQFDYFYEEPQNLEPVIVSHFPWMFRFHSDGFSVVIRLKNTSPSVTAINITCNTDLKTYEMKKFTEEYGQRKGEEYYTFYFSSLLDGNEIEIMLNLYKSNILCSSLPVAKGRAVAKITNKLLKKEFQHFGTRLNHGCVLVVDLINICDGPPLVTETEMDTTTENVGADVEIINANNTYSFNFSTNLEITTNKNSAIDTENTKEESSQNIVLIYVIPSVLGMCVIILVIYKTSVKKYCHRNLNPVETIELNTYSTANEVVYADLGFVHGDSQPPRPDEESPYARIIGVLKPVAGNVNNK